MQDLPELSIVVPLFNEEAGIPALEKRLVKVCEQITENYEIVLVNDGSKDGTLKGIKAVAEENPRIHFVSFSRNFGHQVAVMAGLDHTRGKAVVIIDGDLQDPPELIPELYKKYLQGYKVVYARRKSRNGETFFKKWTAKVFYRLLARLTHVDIPLDTGDFRLIDRQVVTQLQSMPEYHKFLRGQIAWIGFSQTYVEFDRDARQFGNTHYPFKKMLKFALDGITSFSNVPLRLASVIGFWVSGIAFLVILYALVAHFFLGQTVTGWTSLIISMMFIGGIQLITIGVIGEYIARIHTQVRNRPLYIVEESDLSKNKIQ